MTRFIVVRRGRFWDSSSASQRTSRLQHAQPERVGVKRTHAQL
jgi:hypothetical protein